MSKVKEEMFGFFKVEPEMVPAAGMMFDMGTVRLYNEIHSIFYE